MDHLLNSAIPPASVNIVELHFVDHVTTSDSSTTRVSTDEQQYHHVSLVTSNNKASVNMEQLAGIQEGQEKGGQENQPMEIPQHKSQTHDSTLEDDEDLPNKLKQRNVCDRCGIVFRSRSSYIEHIRIAHTNTTHTCHICGRTMKWKSNLTVHLRKFHDIGGPKKILKKNRTCQKCGATFRNNGLLYFHLRKIHKIAKPISCEICGKTFKDVGPTYSNHKRVHPEHYNYFTCDACKLVFTTIANLRKHLEQTGHVTNVKGEIEANGDVISDDTKGQHILGEIETEDHSTSGDKKQTDADFSCPHKCGGQFRTYQGYYLHITKKSCQNGRKQCKKILPPMKTNEGPLCCGKVYKSPIEYREHINIHRHNNPSSGEGGRKKDFECPVCKVLVNGGGLLYHQKRHSGVNDFACDQCDYKCILFKDLTKHKLIHSNSRPHPCKFCNRTFRSISETHNHEKMHISVQNDISYECLKCQRKFHNDKEGKRHQEKCNGVNFGNMHALASGSIGYICNVCLGFYWLKSSLSTHKKNECYKKGIVKAETEMEHVRNETIKIPDETGVVREIPLEALYICKVCSQVFENACDHKAHECQCRPYYKKHKYKPRGKKMCKGSGIKTGAANDIHDDADDNDDEVIEVERSDSTSSNTRTVQAKQIFGSVRQKGEQKAKQMCEGSYTWADGANDNNDDGDDSDDKITEDKESDITDTYVSSPFSITKTIQAWPTEQTVSIKQENIATSSPVPSSIKCGICHKTTAEIIRQECVYHHVVGQTDQHFRHHIIESHPDNVQMQEDTTELECNTCQKTTERLLMEHRCIPHFYCSECSRMFTSKSGLERHLKNHGKQDMLPIFQ